jgi:hypothetical protein
MSFGKLQSMGGNYVSRLGGADILSQDQLQELTPQELTKYNQEKEMSKTAGMRELASRLSDAFAGRDIVGRAAEREKLNIIKKEKLKAQEEKQAFKDISKNINRNDYKSNKEYYFALGKGYLDKGYTSQGIQLLEFAKPTDAAELSKQLISSRNTENKTFKAVNSGLNNYKQILDAAESTGGAASYALMVKFIKQLDDSVVKEGEVRSFGEFQGLADNLRNNIKKAEGTGFTGKTKADILNLATKTLDTLVEDYNNYREGTNYFYNNIGLNPNLIFSGLDLNLEGVELGKTWSAEDFSDEDIDVIPEK